ncbi:hypothetical protein AcV5_003296 [Taiwanofungus camphoratus]|nr:hypothetical protein AcV5_003296 [Antrodia cinnamomea]KAI0918192.1 hypothetical protein AcV7_006995 [Antrodia cinnamomea]
MSSQSPTIDNPRSIAEIYPHGPNDFHIALGQIEERVQLVKAWGIQPGENIIEIGCGQGDCTVTLATAVGEKGSVTAVDPASLDYGLPFTLGQAQAHLRSSPVGSRIHFVQADPLDFLKNNLGNYTTAVLAHSIWYFSSPSTFSTILVALASRVQRICVAEWALTASDPRAVPHVLAALAQASLECRKPTSTGNIRTVLSPAALRDAASIAGLKLWKEDIIPSPEGMFDGLWEVSAVLSNSFEEDIVEYVQDVRERAAVFAMRDGVKTAEKVVKTKAERIRAMDVWVATYVKK